MTAADTNSSVGGFHVVRGDCAWQTYAAPRMRDRQRSSRPDVDVSDATRLFLFVLFAGGRKRFERLTLFHDPTSFKLKMYDQTGAFAPCTQREGISSYAVARGSMLDFSNGALGETRRAGKRVDTDAPRPLP